MCSNCRWSKYKPKYPCSLCVYFDQCNGYNFFATLEQPTMFGPAELDHCRSCGKKVSLRRDGKYLIIECQCGNTMRAKCNAEEMIERWNNRVPAQSSIWKVGR